MSPSAPDLAKHESADATRAAPTTPATTQLWDHSYESPDGGKAAFTIDFEGPNGQATGACADRHGDDFPMTLVIDWIGEDGDPSTPDVSEIVLTV